MKARISREIYIPTGAVKVTDKQSDAVAYIYTSFKDTPAALLFFGEQAKPVWNKFFTNDRVRSSWVKEGFEARQKQLSQKAQRRAEKAAQGSGLVAGDILVSSWGYEQTNIDYYEVVATSGKNSVTIRQIAAHSTSTGNLTGYSVPQSGQVIGEPMRKIARDGRVRITSFSSAKKWNTDTVAGVPVGPKQYWTAYA